MREITQWNPRGLAPRSVRKVLTDIKPLKLSSIRQAAPILDLTLMLEVLLEQPFEDEKTATSVWFDFITAFKQFWIQPLDSFATGFSEFELSNEEIDNVLNLDQYSETDQLLILNWIQGTYFLTAKDYLADATKDQGICVVEHPLKPVYALSHHLTLCSHQLFV